MAAAPPTDPGPPPDATASASGSEDEIRRLRWQCRRGMLELDHLLDRFLDLGYGALNAPQRLAFVRLLAEPDPRLSDWLLSRADPPDPELRELVRHLVEVVRAQGS